MKPARSNLLVNRLNQERLRKLLPQSRRKFTMTESSFFHFGNRARFPLFATCPAQGHGRPKTRVRHSGPDIGSVSYTHLDVYKRQNQEGGQDRSLLFPTIQSLLTSTGYTPQQQSDITQQSLGAANTAYDALRESAANHAAATNDTAGYGLSLIHI